MMHLSLNGAGLTRAFLLLALSLCALASAAHAQTAATPPLVAAAERGDAQTVERLIRERAAINARDAQGRTALLAATQHNHLTIARLLIAAGADVNLQDNIQDSPYLLAGARGHTEILKLTLTAGADLKSTNRYGGTALTPACHYGHVDTVRELLKTSVALDHVNNLGWTCLLEAVILGDGGPRHAEIVRLVTAAGANVNLADRDGVTPLRHARQRGQSAVVRILEQAGAR